jgi:hypothetical protein
MSANGLFPSRDLGSGKQLQAQEDADFPLDAMLSRTAARGHAEPLPQQLTSMIQLGQQDEILRLFNQEKSPWTDLDIVLQSEPKPLTALEWAVACDQKEIARMLISLGATVKYDHEAVAGLAGTAPSPAADGSASADGSAADSSAVDSKPDTSLKCWLETKAQEAEAEAAAVDSGGTAMSSFDREPALSFIPKAKPAPDGDLGGWLHKHVAAQDTQGAVLRRTRWEASQGSDQYHKDGYTNLKSQDMLATREAPFYANPDRQGELKEYFNAELSQAVEQSPTDETGAGAAAESNEPPPAAPDTTTEPDATEVSAEKPGDDAGAKPADAGAQPDDAGAKPDDAEPTN